MRIIIATMIILLFAFILILMVPIILSVLLLMVATAALGPDHTAHSLETPNTAFRF